MKLRGLRVDLGRVERLLGDAGYEAVVGGDDTGLRIAVAPRMRELRQAAKVRRAAAVASGVGPAVIDVAVTPIPLLDNGKVDRIGADALVRAATRDECSQTRRAVDDSRSGATVSVVAATIGDVLALDAVDPDKSFVEHGGDSLTHVPATARLTALVGDLPRDWHRRPVRELATATAQRRGTIETSVVVRAIAVVMICASHTQVVDLAGGAHILLALAGWSAARFGLALPDTGRRWRATLRSVIGIGVPTACAAFIGMALTERYGWPYVFMLNWLFGSTSDSRVELWFIDALVLSLLVLTALVAIPAVARARDRDPWRLYLLIAALALVPRFVTQAVTDRPIDGLPYTVFWIVATVLRDGRFRQVAPPRTVYGSPVDPHVATFLGEAMILPGTPSQGKVHCRLGDLTVAGFMPSGACEVMVRPEQVQVSPAGTGVVDAVVESCVYYGHDALMNLRIGDSDTVKARVVGADSMEPGEHVALTVRGPVRVFAAQD